MPSSSISVPDTLYSCPMHSQIRLSTSGSCPICGMTLEPAAVAQRKGEDRELTDMTRRFIVGALLATPVVALAMGGHLTGLHLNRCVPMAASMILIMSAEVLERFEKVDTLVVDKTGTLTEGKPGVTAVIAAAGSDEATVLLLGASLEKSSYSSFRALYS